MSDHEHPHTLAGSPAVALGAGLGVCLLAVFLLSGLTFYFHRKRKPPTPEELLTKLNTTSPVRKLEEWWSNNGRELGSSEVLDRLFNWVS
ncbi:hypothetical protein N7493_004763 [Penicillium malachiteum]|uniref:Uncharacterized protein n=1 Tax=Penicillium malachiteum TaxID=1324776 RepID=A0AAD6HP65_9EURO|nr:hypothetical protein N7493_004763 [Penicillium malachiteum]